MYEIKHSTTQYIIDTQKLDNSLLQFVEASVVVDPVVVGPGVVGPGVVDSGVLGPLIAQSPGPLLSSI